MNEIEAHFGVVKRPGLFEITVQRLKQFPLGKNEMRFQLQRYKCLSVLSSLLFIGRGIKVYCNPEN